MKLKHCFNAEIVDLKGLISLLKNCKIIHTLPNIESHPNFSSLRRFPMDMSSISSKLSKKRELKFIDELKSIEQACKYTSGGIKHIMKRSKPTMSQIELIGLFKHYLSKFGIQKLSFNPIQYNDFAKHRKPCRRQPTYGGSNT